MDQHVPPDINRNIVETEFEYFHENINDISNIPQHQLNNTKTKLRSTFEKYCTTKTPNKYQEIMKQLSVNKAIFIMKQDKGHDVVIMN